MQIKYSGEITIEQALADMRAKDETFWIAWVRATGKDRGCIKVIAKAKYGAPISGRGRNTNSDGSMRNTALHVDKGTLPLTDYDSGRYLTPLISHVVGFNLKKVIHSNEQKK